MVQVTFKVVNENDPHTRTFGMWLNQIPPEDWTVNPERSFDYIQSGDTVSSSVNISDGKHTLYVAIAQADSSIYGPWTVEADFDGIKAPILSNIDVDTLGRYDITVKDNKVVSTVQNKEEIDEAGKNFIEKHFSAISDKVKSATEQITTKIESNKRDSAIVGSISVAASIAAVIFSQRRPKRF